MNSLQDTTSGLNACGTGPAAGRKAVFRGGAGATTSQDGEGWSGPGSQIGPYRTLRRLGEGGFGVVWLAEQLEPICRRVALKVLKPGMDSPEVLARFEAERQALAMLDHPNITRILDAGTTEGGRPWLAMELVAGTPLLDYCDSLNLNARERLALFIPICEAIQHAHEKGIVHRDIKPGNILVTLQEGRPVPKVIDFGIAKTLAGPLTQRTLVTGTHQIIGTPMYMSPEQADMTGLGIDARSDIYSLGVLLYELLTGVTPFDGRIFRRAGFGGIRRYLQEVDPPTPSIRVATLCSRPVEGDDGGDLPEPSAADIARHRRTDPSALARELKGALDWITMKCLEKDRVRRYATAGNLMLDVRRFLDDEPVNAGPARAGYRFGRWARRNQGRLAAAGAILLSVVAGLTFAGWGLSEARRERELAVAAQAVAASEAARAQEAGAQLATLLARLDRSGDGRTASISGTMDEATAAAERTVARGDHRPE